MRFLLIAIAFLVGCGEIPALPDGHDAGGTNCQENSPPFIGNLEMNSVLAKDGLSYGLSLHFDWRDPGVSGGADLPNMSGGYVSAELYGYGWDSDWLTPENLVSTCIVGEGVDCAAFGHGSNGCASIDSLDTCTQGEITIVRFGEEPFVKYQDILMEFRVRDRCGDQSNFKVVEYEIGSGHLVETAAPEAEQ